MALSDNPFRNRVTLKPDALTILVEVIKRDDESVVETAEFAGADVHTNLRNNVALYGLSKLLQDRTSEVPTGPGKVAAMKELMEQFKSGTWTAERKAGAPVVSAEVEAVAELKGCTTAEAQLSLKGYDVETRKKILANPKVVALAQEIRGRRTAATPTDLSDLTA